MNFNVDRTTPDVRPKQVWADNDKRVQNREVRVERIEHKPGGAVAVCTVVRNDNAPNTVGQIRRIAVRRFRPTSTGYRFLRSEVSVKESLPEHRIPIIYRQVDGMMDELVDIQHQLPDDSEEFVLCGKAIQLLHQFRDSLA